jgi:hypothetical protein
MPEQQGARFSGQVDAAAALKAVREFDTHRIELGEQGRGR